MTGAQKAVAQNAHILVVDDDTRLRGLIGKYLGDSGYAVTAAQNAADARRLMQLFTFDCMVLDIMMPGETGLQFAQTVDTRATPILLLSARAEAHQRIEGLETGVQDYLVKPFEPRELTLRIENILRTKRQSHQQQNRARFGRYAFDMHTGSLFAGDEEIYLTTAERQLLRALVDGAGAPVSRELLAREGGGEGSEAANERSVDVQINRLRKKIDAPGTGISLIRTVRGAGYVLDAEKP